jgi:hypothetical protein
MEVLMEFHRRIRIAKGVYSGKPAYIRFREAVS